MSGKKTKIKDLIPDDQNFNTGTEFGGGLIEKSLSKFGAGRSILLDKNNRIIAGNKTVENAAAIGLDDVQIVETDGKTIIAVKRTDIDLDTKRGREMALADNATAKANISWDAAAITEWEMPYQEWGIDLATEIEPAGEADAEPQIDKAAELNEKWQVKAGDLWQIGGHRLLCGDSTEAEQVARLMQFDRAEVVFTDPPYGVNVKGGALSSQMISGDLTQTAIPFAFELAVNNATTSDARFYFCGAEGNIALYGKLFDRYLRRLPRHLIWVKESFVMKPNNYHYQYEMIFYGFKESGGGLNKWFGGRTEHEASDVWQVSRKDDGAYMHPTQKPTELPMRAIRNSCPPGGTVYEPFGGSGSTLIAAENLKRQCRAIELDPDYCAVILERMHTAFPEIEIKRIEDAAEAANG